MCDVHSTSTTGKNGSISTTMVCKTSGKPITKSNKYGMFCEDMCNLQECKDVHKKLMKLFSFL